MKPSVFIGSSAEALPLATAVKAELAKSFRVDLWSDSLFELGQDTLDNLLRFVQCYDFAVLVLSDDDQTISRKAASASPRDNVVFELGLFLGALGRRRAFPIILQTAQGAPKIPSDLLGNSAVYLPKNFHKNIDAAKLGGLLAQLTATIQQRSLESSLQLLPSTGLAIGYFQNFVVPVCQELVERQTVTVGGAEVDISRNNFDFTIVLPATLIDASIQGARKFTKTWNTPEFVLKTSTRSYPFYVKSTVQDGRVIFYDYPTTLRASRDAIQIALAGPYLGYGKYHEILEEKEIANFERTISILLQDGVAAGFRDNVKILHVT